MYLLEREQTQTAAAVRRIAATRMLDIVLHQLHTAHMVSDGTVVYISHHEPQFGPCVNLRHSTAAFTASAMVSLSCLGSKRAEHAHQKDTKDRQHELILSCQ